MSFVINKGFFVGLAIPLLLDFSYQNIVNTIHGYNSGRK